MQKGHLMVGEDSKDPSCEDAGGVEPRHNAQPGGGTTEASGTDGWMDQWVDGQVTGWKSQQAVPNGPSSCLRSTELWKHAELQPQGQQGSLCPLTHILGVRVTGWGH